LSSLNGGTPTRSDSSSGMGRFGEEFLLITASAMTTTLPHRDYIHQNPASAVWWRTQAIIAFVQPSPDSNCIKRTQRLKPTWLSIRGTTEVVPFPVQKKRHPSDDPFDPSTGSGREETCR